METNETMLKRSKFFTYSSIGRQDVQNGYKECPHHPPLLPVFWERKALPFKPCPPESGTQIALTKTPSHPRNESRLLY